MSTPTRTLDIRHCRRDGHDYRNDTCAHCRQLAPTHPRILAVLLSSLHDRLRDIQSPRWQRETNAGWARVWVRCTTCKGTGTIAWHDRQVRCDNKLCKGAGGWYGDPMMSKEHRRQVEENLEEDSTVTAFARRVTAMTLPELEHLDHAIDVTLGLADDLEQKAQALARHDHPSVLMVWDGLSLMLRDFPKHAGILYRVHVWAFQPPINEYERELLDDALRMLGQALLALHPRFAPPPWAVKAAQDELRTMRAELDRRAQQAARWPDRHARDNEIHRLATMGRSVRWIEKHTGIGRETVRKVLARDRGLAA